MHPGPAAITAEKSPSRAVLAVLTASAALGVANLYYGQPMAAAIARDLAASERAIGLALTGCQVGYTVGMLLLVPLGDGRERRSLATITALASAIVLALLAATQTFPLFAALMFLLGIASSLPQMLLPIAVSLADERARGAIIGTIMGGLLAGILLSRTVSGMLTEAIGYRATFLCAAVLMALVAIVLRLALPHLAPPSRIRVSTILASMASLLGREPRVRKHGVVGACGFAAFSVFWATLAFHLHRLGHGPRVAGLYGVLGLSGVVVAPVIGRLSSRVPAPRLNAVSLAVVALGFAVFALAPSSLVALAVGVVLLDAGAQANHVTNQNVILGLSGEHRNRFNAIYMVLYFMGGSLGSLAASAVWPVFGWIGSCALGLAFAAIGAAIALRPAARPGAAEPT